MSTELIACGILAVIVVAVLLDRQRIATQYESHIQTIRDTSLELHARHIHAQERWNEERNKYLDRLSAPTFMEYKQAEVKMAKVTNQEREARDPLGMELL